MSNTPPVPSANTSPFPIAEAPHDATTQPAAAANAATDAVGAGVKTIQDNVGPLAEKAKTFARERPYATAALVGTIALAVFNTLRGKRA